MLGKQWLSISNIQSKKAVCFDFIQQTDTLNPPHPLKKAMR